MINRFLNTVISISVIIAATHGPVAEAASCTVADFSADLFVERWNQEIASLTIGTWRLEKYGGLGFIRQNLDGPDLTLSVQIDKNRCITKIQVTSRRDGDGFAAQVSWVKIIKITNPTITNDIRKNIYRILNMDEVNAGGAHTH
ncbi:hypothetical protein [Ancylobacter sp. SL191]|uniref:hypothetical protein n=1 Tax=Ancylobacter sp. SL191 TaxID=2995166 RepID=UPI00226D8B48|nr:hypothetical protein [Ancylobacter sp. SL191]WAC27887.1 hypothetical protein OU996_02065 [Ancylobacter sp. SL191]